MALSKEEETRRKSPTSTTTLPNCNLHLAMMDGEHDDSATTKKEDDEVVTTETNSSMNDTTSLHAAEPRGESAKEDEDNRWNAMLFQLLLFRSRRGDTNIPANDPTYRELYNWIQLQKEQYALYQIDPTSPSTILNADRVAVLESIEFQHPNREEALWQMNLDALITYKNEHDGSIQVPRQYEKAPRLADWMTEQRKQHKALLEGRSSTLTAERMAKLDKVGFVWQLRDRMDWNERYEKLIEYKKEHGHCIVPQNYTKSNSLGKWVAKQREQYRFYQEGEHSFLTTERIDLLNAIGFVWRIKGKGGIRKGGGTNIKGIHKTADAASETPNTATNTTTMTTATSSPPHHHNNHHLQQMSQAMIIPNNNTQPNDSLQQHHQRLAAKILEEEKKLVELKSAMSIIAPEETQHHHYPHHHLHPTTNSTSMTNGSTNGASAAAAGLSTAAAFSARGLSLGEYYGLLGGNILGQQPSHPTSHHYASLNPPPPHHHLYHTNQNTNAFPSQSSSYAASLQGYGLWRR